MSTYDYAVIEVIRVVDGDTVDLRIDLGLHLNAALRFRIKDYDTPERGQRGWAEATNAAREWLDGNADNIRVRTYKADSFGRWLGDIYDVPSGQSMSKELTTFMEAEYGIDCRWKG